MRLTSKDDVTTQLSITPSILTLIFCLIDSRLCSSDLEFVELIDTFHQPKATRSSNRGWSARDEPVGAGVGAYLAHLSAHIPRCLLINPNLDRQNISSAVESRQCQHSQTRCIRQFEYTWHVPIPLRRAIKDAIKLVGAVVASD